MQKVIGVTTEKSSNGRVTYYARGFEIHYYLLDGFPVTQNCYIINSYNMDAYDRVEIVKGTNGLLAGARNLAVSINMVKYANSKVFKCDIEVSAGSWICTNYKQIFKLL